MEGPALELADVAGAVRELDSAAAIARTAASPVANRTRYLIPSPLHAPNDRPRPGHVAEAEGYDATRAGVEERGSTCSAAASRAGMAAALEGSVSPRPRPAPAPPGQARPEPGSRSEGRLYAFLRSRGHLTGTAARPEPCSSPCGALSAPPGRARHGRGWRVHRQPRPSAFEYHPRPRGYFGAWCAALPVAVDERRDAALSPRVSGQPR